MNACSGTSNGNQLIEKDLRAIKTVIIMYDNEKRITHGLCLCVSFLVIAGVGKTGSEPVRISIAPTVLTVNQTERATQDVTVTCYSKDIVFETRILAITLYTQQIYDQNASSEIILAYISFPFAPYLNHNLPTDLAAKQPTVSGFISADRPFRSFLTLSIKSDNWTCADSRSFRCGIIYHGHLYEEFDSLTLTVYVLPSPLQLAAFIFEKNGFREANATSLGLLEMGTRLKFVCTGNTGSDPDASIIWEAMSEEVFVVLSQSLSSDVRIDEVYESTGGCTVSRRSELLYNIITAADTKNFIIRCKVKIQPPQLQMYEVSSSYYHLQKGSAFFCEPTSSHIHLHDILKPMEQKNRGFHINLIKSSKCRLPECRAPASAITKSKHKIRIKDV